MPTDNGYSNQKKKGVAQFETVHNLGSGAYGKQVSPKGLFVSTAASAIVSVTPIVGSNGNIQYWNIELTSHGAYAGNVMRITTSGQFFNTEFEIIEIIDANNFYVLPITDSILTAGLDAAIMGQVTQVLSSDGEISVAITSAPISYNYDGNPQTVEQDTSDVTNNRALPNLNFIYKDGNQVPITKDTGTPANTIGMPVEIVAASGTPINITAGDINVQLTDLGVNFDAVRLGDGSGNYVGVTASNELQVTGTVTTGGLTDAELRATPVPVSGPLTDTELRATPVPVSGTVSTGGLTDTELRATPVAVSGPLTDTELRATAVPVSAASLPLPSGAATEAKQDSNITAIGTMSAKLPAALGQTNNAGSLSTTLSTEIQAILEAIRDGANASVPNGSSQSNGTVGTSAANVTIPANTVGCIIQGYTGNAGLYWSLGGTAANDGTSGHKLEDSRDTGFIPYAGTGNLSVIGEAASTRYQITWFTRS